VSATNASSETGVQAQEEARCQYVLRLADTSLVLGQRLAEWIGHAPALEEDLALANLSLDLIGQARLLLGDGTAESHERVQRALDALWRFTPELFEPDEIDQRMSRAGIAPALPELAAQWSARVERDLSEATLTRPATGPYPWHGKRGVHTEHLGHLLGEMQHLQRTYPGACW